VPSFSELARGLGFDLSPAQLEAFAVFRDRIIEASTRFNLTAVRDPKAIEQRHFLESLALGRLLLDEGALPPGGSCTALDLGSGAGLPGLPLKIALPLLRVDLLEAIGKRCQFLRETIEALGLREIGVLEGRAETFARAAAHRAAYDLVVARAVAPLPLLIEYTLPFLRAGGLLAAPKGSAAPTELAASGPALRELNGEVRAVVPFGPPFGARQTLVLIAKIGPTPERFPRKAGIARKRPLA
jgi:16S rRNA (guanine527-N7)-methyltransferase